MTAALVTGGRGDEDGLADAVHKVLATLADMRADTSALEIRDRIALVRWLRIELWAAETLLTASYRQRGGATDASPGAERAG